MKTPSRQWKYWTPDATASPGEVLVQNSYQVGPEFRMRFLPPTPTRERISPDRSPENTGSICAVSFCPK